MKTNYQLTAGRGQRSTKKGFTLIEITLVIALLLGLISVLFIGISAYKQGSNRAICLLAQVTLQKAMRSYVNLNPTATTTNETDVLGPGNYAADPGTVGACPANGTYTYASASVPAEGVEWCTCSLAAAPDLHAPTATQVAGW